jgi:hypothetical protein
MSRIDVGVLAVHLFKIACTHNLILLTCIAGNPDFDDALDTKLYKLAMFLLVTGVVGIARMLGITPRLHIAWVWVVIAAGVPWFTSETKSDTAFFMLVGIAALLSLTRLVDALSNRARVRKLLLVIEQIIPPLDSECVLNATLLKILEWILFLGSNATVILVGKDIDEWDGAFMTTIIVLGIAVALRYTEHGMTVVGIAAGWVAMAVWCCPSDSSIDSED